MQKSTKRSKIAVFLVMLMVLFSTLGDSHFVRGSELTRAIDRKIVQQESTTTPTSVKSVIESSEENNAIPLNSLQSAARNLVTNDSATSASCTVRIEGDGESIIPPTEVAIENFDLSKYHVESQVSDTEMSVLHAFIKALEQNGFNPASDNVFTISEYGYLTSVDGLAAEGNAGWMYVVNNQSPWDTMNAHAVSPYDKIVIYYTPDYNKYAYAYFDKEALSVKGGQSFTLTLSKLGYDSSWNEISIPCADTKIMIDGQETSYVTDKDGKVTLAIDNKGSYLITAADIDSEGDNVLLAAQSQVTVGDDVTEETMPLNQIKIEGKTQSGESKSYELVMQNGKYSYNVETSFSELETLTFDAAAKTIYVNSKKVDADYKAEVNVTLTNEPTTFCVMVQDENSTTIYYINVKKGQEAGVIDKETAIEESLEVISQQYTNTHEDWQAMDMKIYDADSQVDEEALLAKVRSTITSTTSATDIERMVLTMTALGYDMSNLSDGQGGTINALSIISHMEKLGTISALEYALLAYDSGDYETAALGENPVWTREKLINEIMKYQRADGGFSYSSSAAAGDADITAVTISALAPYMQTDEKVRKVVDNAISYLSNAQLEDGSYNSNSNSTAMVIIALTNVGIDIDTDARFIKNGKTTLDALLNYRLSTGTFGYRNNTTANSLSTEQSFRALASYKNAVSSGDYYSGTYRFGKPSKTGEGIVTLQSLVVDKMPSKTSYNIGEEFVKDGLVLKAVYSDGNEKYISAEEITITGYDSKASGTKTISAEYGGLSTPFSITIIKTNSDNTYKYTATLKVYDPSGRTYFEAQEIEIEENETALSLLEKSNLDVSISSSSQGRYVEGIEGLYEFDKGSQSGWMYSVNGIFPEKSADQYELEDGDQVVWVYTRDLGNDVGGGASGSASSSTENTITVKPSVNEAGNMSVDISKAKFEEVLENSALKECTLDIRANQQSQSLEATLPVESLNALAQQDSMTLVVQTDLATLELNKACLKAIIDACGSKTGSLTITINKVDTSSLNENVKDIAEDHTILEFNLTSNKKTISEFGGNGIKITIPYELKAGEKAENMMVYYITPEGTLEAVKDASYSESLHAMRFTVMHFSQYMISPKLEEAVQEESVKEEVSVPHFKDVTGWAEEYINQLVEKGIAKGRSEEYFYPNEAITRAEFITLLARIENVETASETVSFEDVEKDSWYSDAVAWAFSQELIKGDGKYFYPNKNITREDMAVILARYIESKNLGSTETNSIVFKDADTFSDYAKEAVEKLGAIGIVSGDQKQAFNPKNTATRAEIAKVLIMVINLSE